MEDPTNAEKALLLKIPFLDLVCIGYTFIGIGRTTVSCSWWKSGSTWMGCCVDKLSVGNGLGEWCIGMNCERCEGVWINFEPLDACVSNESEALDAVKESEALDEWVFNDSVTVDENEWLWDERW